MYRRNASASSADTTAATELALFAANDGDLYRSQAQPIITNLAKKMGKGQYDEAKAAKLWGYFANTAAQKYAWEFGDRKRGTRSWREQSVDGNGMFNAATRRFASAELEHHYRDEVTSLATTARMSARSNPRSSGQTYNGHPSRAHWNVALWVANDYGLYQAVSRMGKAEAVEFLMDSFPRTPDGVKMTKTLAAYAWRSLKD